MFTMLDMPKPEKRAPANRSGTPVSFRFNDDLMDAFRTFHETLRPRPSFTALMEDAVAEYLEKRGVAVAKPAPAKKPRS